MALIVQHGQLRLTQAPFFHRQIWGLQLRKVPCRLHSFIAFMASLPSWLHCLHCMPPKDGFIGFIARHLKVASSQRHPKVASSLLGSLHTTSLHALHCNNRNSVHGLHCSRKVAVSTSLQSKIGNWLHRFHCKPPSTKWSYAQLHVLLFF